MFKLSKQIVMLILVGFTLAACGGGGGSVSIDNGSIVVTDTSGNIIFKGTIDEDGNFSGTGDDGKVYNGTYDKANGTFTATDQNGNEYTGTVDSDGNVTSINPVVENSNDDTPEDEGSSEPAPEPTPDPADTATWSNWVEGVTTTYEDTPVTTYTEWVITPAPSDQQVTIRTRTKTVTISNRYTLRTDTRVCEVHVNGETDSPAPTCSGETTQTIKIELDDEVTTTTETEQLINPDYVDPTPADPADTATWGEWYETSSLPGYEVETRYTEWTPTTASSDQETIDQTRFKQRWAINRKLTIAQSRDCIVTINGEEDTTTPTCSGHDSQVIVEDVDGEELIDSITETQTVDNPAYIAPLWDANGFDSNGLYVGLYDLTENVNKSVTSVHDVWYNYFDQTTGALSGYDSLGTDVKIAHQDGWSGQGVTITMDSSNQLAEKLAPSSTFVDSTGNDVILTLENGGIIEFTESSLSDNSIAGGVAAVVSSKFNQLDADTLLSLIEDTKTSAGKVSLGNALSPQGLLH